MKQEFTGRLVPMQPLRCPLTAKESNHKALVHLKAVLYLARQKGK